MSVVQPVSYKIAVSLALLANGIDTASEGRSNAACAVLPPSVPSGVIAAGWTS